MAILSDSTDQNNSSQIAVGFQTLSAAWGSSLCWRTQQVGPDHSSLAIIALHWTFNDHPNGMNRLSIQ
jgi:hypothetical protein